jgi:predicted MFS family arabinose efflux permease
VSDFTIITIIAGLIGAAVYFSIVWFAGTRGWRWLALLVSLPAILATVMFMQMPPGFSSRSSSFLFRNFDKFGVAQVIAGLITYLLGRSFGRSRTMNKGQN